MPTISIKEKKGYIYEPLQKRMDKFAFVARRPHCPGRPKKLCFTTQSLAVKTVGARLSVIKQSSFGLPGQYGRRVTKANGDLFIHTFTRQADMTL